MQATRHASDETGNVTTRHWKESKRAGPSGTAKDHPPRPCSSASCPSFCGIFVPAALLPPPTPPAPPSLPRRSRCCYLSGPSFSVFSFTPPPLLPPPSPPTPPLLRPPPSPLTPSLSKSLATMAKSKDQEKKLADQHTSKWATYQKAFGGAPSGAVGRSMYERRAQISKDVRKASGKWNLPPARRRRATGRISERESRAIRAKAIRASQTSSTTVALFLWLLRFLLRLFSCLLLCHLLLLLLLRRRRCHHHRLLLFFLCLVLLPSGWHFGHDRSMTSNER